MSGSLGSDLHMSVLMDEKREYQRHSKLIIAFSDYASQMCR